MEVVKGPDIIQATQFDQLVADHQTALLRICYIYLKDRALAEDAVQETYLKAYKGMAHFRGECSEKAWLMKIAINTCRDIQRSFWFRHMDRRITPELMVEKSVTPREDDCGLAMEIMCLPAKLKEILLLYYYQGMTAAEVSQTLGISKVTVSHRLKKAKERLRVALKGGGLCD